jgi:hypothetical protein
VVDLQRYSRALRLKTSRLFFTGDELFTND